MHHNLIIKNGDATQVVKEILVDGVQFVDEEPVEGSPNLVTSDAVAKLGETLSEGIADKYVPGNTYRKYAIVEHDDKTYINLYGTISDGAWDGTHWTEKPIGDIINEGLDRVMGAIVNGGELQDAASIDVFNNAVMTLTTAQSALTLNVNLTDDEVANFAVEITASADCTLTLTSTNNNFVTTLCKSAAGGDSLEAGKFYQVTCVGKCWTLAEFEVPTP